MIRENERGDSSRHPWFIRTLIVLSDRPLAFVFRNFPCSNQNEKAKQKRKLRTVIFAPTAWNGKYKYFRRSFVCSGKLDD